MAFGGRELRLILSIQSYGTSNIARLRRDLVQLHTAAEAANAKQMAQARVARQMARVSAAEQDLRNIQAGIPYYQARNKAMMQWGRANASVLSTQARQIDLSRRLFDIETKRTLMTRRLKQARPLDLSADQIYALERGLESLNMQEAALTKSSAALSSSLAVQQTQLHAADVAYKELLRTKGAMHAETLAAKQAVDLETASLERLTLAEKQAAIAAKALPIQQLEHTARQVAHLGRTMQFAGLIGTAAFGLAAGSFADFSERASLAATQMRDIGAPIEQTAKRSKELQDRILDLGMQFPASATEMSDAAYEIFSSMNIVRNGVVDTARGYDLLEKANKAAVAGGVELKEATDAMIVVLNNFDPNLNRSTELLNQMFSVVRFGNLRLNDLGSAMNYLAPIAKTVGLNFADVGAAFATLTILTKNTETASTGLARAIELFRLPVVQKGLRKWGVEITDVHNRMLPLNEIIGRLVKRFPGLATGQQSAIEALIQITKASEQTKVGIQGTVQARRAIASLATSTELYSNILKNTTKNKGEFDRAFASRIKDPGVQWQIFLRQMQTLVLIIGRAALPVFLALGERIASFIRWFKELNPTVRDTAIKITAFLAVFALFGGTLINVVGSVYALRLNMKLLALATEETTGRFAALRLVMGTIGLFTLAVIISEMYDLETAIVVTATAWVVWKTKALQSIYAVVVANRLAATAVKTTWRAALSATLFGLLAVAAGIAAEWVITHWNKVIAFFTALKAAIEDSWAGLMQALVGLSLKGVADIVDVFVKLGDVLVPGLASKLKLAGKVIGLSTDDMRATGDALIENSGSLDVFSKAYDKSLKEQEAARKKSQKGFTEYDRVLKGLITPEMLAAQEAFANSFDPDKNGITEAARLAKRRAQATAQAYENMQQKIETAVDNLSQIFDKFQQQNKEAFGSDLFGGSFLTDLFTNLNSQLRQFGIVIPVPFEILQQDMEQRLKFFKRWRESLNKLLARGAPLAFVQELQAMGPEAGLPIAEGLLQGGEKGFEDLIKTWKKGQKLVRKASKVDMDRQLRDWEKHGKNIAWMMINGTLSGLADPTFQAKLRKGFKTYVVDTFGSILKTEMAAEIAEAMSQAMAEGLAVAQATIDATPKDIKPPKIPTVKRITTNIGLTRAQLEATRKQLESLRLQAMGDAGRRVPLTERQQRRLQALQKQERVLETRLAEQRRLRSVTRQLQRERKLGGTTYTITYQGDTVTVRADGATVQSVLAALRKLAFQKKNRNKGRTQIGGHK